jgi:hypothetical protein
MYNRPMCGRSTGAYTNLGDLQRDLMGAKSHPTKKKWQRDTAAQLELRESLPTYSAWTDEMLGALLYSFIQVYFIST